MKRALWFALVPLVFGCAQQPARVSGRWVFLTSPRGIAVGQADTPAVGSQLSLIPGSASADSCYRAEELTQWFGPECEHELEEGPAVTPGTDTGVRWYCRGQLAVRVVFERTHCPEGRMRAAQIAVSTVEPRPQGS